VTQKGAPTGLETLKKWGSVDKVGQSLGDVARAKEGEREISREKTF